MAKSVSYSGLDENGDLVRSDGKLSRQQLARRACRGNDSRGGLLGRLAGRNNGQPAVVEGSLGPNEGSARFRVMQAEAAQASGKAGKFTKADGNNGVW